MRLTERRGPEPVAHYKKTMNPIKEVPLITVKQISRKHLEDLYCTRGELNEQPDLKTSEVAVGMLTNGAGVLVRDQNTFNIRLIWPNRYAISKGCDPRDRDAQEKCLENLPQIFVG